MGMFDWQPLYETLRQRGHERWANRLEKVCDERTRLETHGTLPQWTDAWNALPAPADGELQLGDTPAVVVAGEVTNRERLVETLMQFHPWRKGPFDLFGVAIDTEWRSDWKWQRIKDEINFCDKTILDVGSGNGYYGWKMLGSGAELVLGCDPFLLYVSQCEVLRRYAQAPQSHFVLPLADTDLPTNLRLFDLTLSMGVLYHRSGPIDHLQKLHSTLKPGGELLLETLVLENPSVADVLVPTDRYAKMRNVWFIPTIPMLLTWLARTGFVDARVIDVTATTCAEQRSTSWMTFESLADFLDAQDPRKTIEGYPAPVRATLVARRRR